MYLVPVLVVLGNCGVVRVFKFWRVIGMWNERGLIFL